MSRGRDRWQTLLVSAGCYTVFGVGMLSLLAGASGLTAGVAAAVAAGVYCPLAWALGWREQGRRRLIIWSERLRRLNLGTTGLPVRANRWATVNPRTGRPEREDEL